MSLQSETVRSAASIAADEIPIVDMGAVEPAKIAVLAAAVLALGCVYWLVRDKDDKEREL